MELMVLEFFAAAFLLLSILRPFFKGLWHLQGLALLPPLALAILAGIFPVYGFRPECVPLLVFAAFFNIVQLGGFAALFLSLKNDDYRDRGPAFSLCCLALAGFCAWIAFFFAPPLDFDILGSRDSAAEFTLYDRGRGAELWARLYLPEKGDGGAPLIVAIPPAAASLPAIDPVCAELARRGFAVLSYTRPGFDSPAVSPDGGFRRIFAHWGRIGALLRGRTGGAANEAGRALEEGRREDILFLLEEIASNPRLIEALGGAERQNTVLAGWGAGGAALALLAGDEKFAARFAGDGVRVRGVASIEGPVLSCYEAEALPPLPDAGGNAFMGFVFGARQFALGLLPRRVTGLGKIPRLRIPALFIVSDRAKEESPKNDRYETLRRIAALSPSRARIVSLPGMGPFDYSDSPSLYPLLSFLFRGLPQGAPRAKGDYPVNTAELVADFSLSAINGTLE